MGQLQSASTPYAEVNSLLDSLLTGVQSILGEELIGFYLDGSLALGDFDPATSDVDFIAAIARPLPPAAFEALADTHRRIRDSGLPFATELEGSYIHLSALRRHDPTDAVYPNLERGPNEVLKLKEHHSDWVIHRYTVREHGITLFGPPTATLIDPVSADDVRAATVGVLRSWWGTAAGLIYVRNASPGVLAIYIVPTMCRALYALEYGAVISKPAACLWALHALDQQWQPLIESALRGSTDPSIRGQTPAFVRFTVDSGRRHVR